MDERENIIDKVRNYGALLRESNFPMTWEGNYFDVMPLLWKIRRDIDMRIEPHLIVPQEDYAGFLNEIQQTGILIN